MVDRSPVADHGSEAAPRRAGSHRRRSWLSVAVAVATALALSAVGLAWRDRVRLSTERPDPDLLAFLMLGALLIGAVAYIVAAVLARSGGQQRPRQALSWQQIVARILALALLAYLVTAGGDFRWSLGSPDPSRPGGDSRPTTGRREKADTARAWTQPLSIALLGILLAGVVALLVYLRRRAQPESPGPRRETSEAETARTLAKAAAAGRRALESIEDDRAAVIACYQAMQATLERHGVPGKDTDTATDLLNRAARLGVARGSAATRLVELFGLARFSAQDLPAGASEQARSALLALEAETVAGIR